MSWGSIFSQDANCHTPTLRPATRPVWIYLRFSNKGDVVAVEPSVLQFRSPAGFLPVVPALPSGWPQFTPKFPQFSRNNSLASKNKPAIIVQLLATTTLQITAWVGLWDTLGQKRVIRRISALEYSTKEILLMLERLKCWLHGLWSKPAIRALRLFLSEMLIGVIAYTVLYGGRDLVRFVNDLSANPIASEGLKSIEWLLAVVSYVSMGAFIVCGGTAFLNNLSTIYFGIDFIALLKKRWGLTGSAGGQQPPTPPPGPLPTKPVAPAGIQPGSHTPVPPLTGQSGHQTSSSTYKSDDQSGEPSEAEPNDTPNESPRGQD